MLEGRDADALWEFIHKMNSSAHSVGGADISALIQAGYSEEAVYDAINVCCLFNFYNRWIDASGVHEMGEEAHRQQAKRMAARGYIF